MDGWLNFSHGCGEDEDGAVEREERLDLRVVLIAVAAAAAAAAADITRVVIYRDIFK